MAPRKTNIARIKPESLNVPAHSIGDNVTLEIVNGIATITFDTSVRGGPSSSGKTVRVASTNGNKRVAATSDVFVGLNAYVKA